MSKNAIQCVDRMHDGKTTIYKYKGYTVACQHHRKAMPYNLMLMLRTFVCIIPMVNNEFDLSGACEYPTTSHAESLREYFRTNDPVEYLV
jgi:hypothetical protein